MSAPLGALDLPNDPDEVVDEVTEQLGGGESADREIDWGSAPGRAVAEMLLGHVVIDGENTISGHAGYLQAHVDTIEEFADLQATLNGDVDDLPEWHKRSSGPDGKAHQAEYTIPLQRPDLEGVLGIGQYFIRSSERGSLSEIAALTGEFQAHNFGVTGNLGERGLHGKVTEDFAQATSSLTVEGIAVNLDDVLPSDVAGQPVDLPFGLALLLGQQLKLPGAQQAQQVVERVLDAERRIGAMDQIMEELDVLRQDMEALFESNPTYVAARNAVDEAEAELVRHEQELYRQGVELAAAVMETTGARERLEAAERLRQAALSDVQRATRRIQAIEQRLLELYDEYKKLRERRDALLDELQGGGLQVGGGGQAGETADKTKDGVEDKTGVEDETTGEATDGAKDTTDGAKDTTDDTTDTTDDLIDGITGGGGSSGGGGGSDDGSDGSGGGGDTGDDGGSGDGAVDTIVDDTVDDGLGLRDRPMKMMGRYRAMASLEVIDARMAKVEGEQIALTRDYESAKELQRSAQSSAALASDEALLAQKQHGAALAAEAEERGQYAVTETARAAAQEVARQAGAAQASIEEQVAAGLAFVDARAARFVELHQMLQRVVPEVSALVRDLTPMVEQSLEELLEQLEAAPVFGIGAVKLELTSTVNATGAWNEARCGLENVELLGQPLPIERCAQLGDLVDEVEREVSSFLAQLTITAPDVTVEIPRLESVVGEPDEDGFVESLAELRPLRIRVPQVQVGELRDEVFTRVRDLLDTVRSRPAMEIVRQIDAAGDAAMEKVTNQGTGARMRVAGYRAAATNSDIDESIDDAVDTADQASGDAGLDRQSTTGLDVTVGTLRTTATFPSSAGCTSDCGGCQDDPSQCDTPDPCAVTGTCPPPDPCAAAPASCSDPLHNGQLDGGANADGLVEGREPAGDASELPGTGGGRGSGMDGLPLGDLPHTGGGAALLGLLALGMGLTLRRRT